VARDDCDLSLRQELLSFCHPVQVIFSVSAPEVGDLPDRRHGV
jgi:hypothetical protein